MGEGNRVGKRGEHMKKKEAEHLEPLGNGVQVIVSPQHHFGTDTILLAHFAAPRKNDRACELGTGCGAIPLLWCRSDSPSFVTAIDIQAEACDLLQRSIVLNHLEERIHVLHSDWRELQGKVSWASYDLVVCNPPYKAVGTGIVNPEQAHRMARHEIGGTLENIIQTAAKLLNFAGRFCLCQRPERLNDVIVLMRQYGLEPKRLRLVQQHTTKAPKLFLIEGRRGGRPNGLVVEPTLLIESESGGLSREMIEIYGVYKEAYLP